MQQLDGKLVEKAADKLKVFHEYYKTLCTADLISAEMLDIFHGVSETATLSEIDRETLEAPIQES